ncbi:hypothetical protein DL93DRAFT_1697249 [Clavulina sp. PMI_390]|nr:hypothetical protein DL93DRAFT_1697249 [Clavulina sp. PMI_390]
MSSAHRTRFRRIQRIASGGFVTLAVISLITGLYGPGKLKVVSLATGVVSILGSWATANTRSQISELPLYTDLASPVSSTSMTTAIPLRTVTPTTPYSIRNASATNAPRLRFRSMSQPSLSSSFAADWVNEHPKLPEPPHVRDTIRLSLLPIHGNASPSLETPLTASSSAFSEASPLQT